MPRALEAVDGTFAVSEDDANRVLYVSTCGGWAPAGTWNIREPSAMALSVWPIVLTLGRPNILKRVLCNDSMQEYLLV